MGYYVEVKHESYPDVKEPVATYSVCKGNILSAIEELTGVHLSKAGPNTASASLASLIAELDKGNTGMFNDAYAADADLKWSKGKESAEEYARWATALEHALGKGTPMPFTDYQTFCGWRMRDRLRDDAVRFFLYYKAGYQVTFTF